MRSRMTFGLATLLALVVPAAAHAATIHQDAGHVYYDAVATDQVYMIVNAGFDQEFANSAIFFVPTTNQNGPPHTNPTTSDSGCRASSTSGYKCLSPNDREVDVTAGNLNDFVRVAAANSLLVFHGGGGSDRIFVDNGTRLTAFGDAGNDWLQGGPSFDTFDGGLDDDLIDPLGFGDDVKGGPGVDTVRMQSGGVVMSLDDQPNDGPVGNASENIHSDVERVQGGSGNDDLTGNNGANTLEGGDGNDTITGLGGVDTLSGGVGDDTIQARDGGSDAITCGAGNDRALVDPADQPAADCETVVYADSDGDGADARSDCNDANPAFHPGATDVPGNGVDEDCSGADATPATTTTQGAGTTTIITGVIDADHDGSSPPADCNDADASMHPGAKDTPGDVIDQDCNGTAAPFPLLDAHIVHGWDLALGWSRVVQMSVTGAPAGSKATIRCRGRGCPFATRSVSLPRGRGRLAKVFKHRKLAKGTVVDVAITAPDHIGKVLRFTIVGKKKLPRQQRLCIAPAGRKPQVCG